MTGASADSRPAKPEPGHADVLQVEGTVARRLSGHVGHEDRHRTTATGSSGYRTGDEGELVLTVEPMAAHNDGRRVAHDWYGSGRPHCAAGAPLGAELCDLLSKGGRHIRGDGLLGRQVRRQLVAVSRNGSVAPANATRRRRSDRPETRPAQARSDFLVEMFLSDQTRRKATTGSVPLTGPS